MMRMGLLESLRTLVAGSKAVIPREPSVFRPIGVVRNRVQEPQPHGWQAVRSDIILREELEEALEGIEGFSHVIIVFHIDRVPEEEKRLRVKVGSDSSERGVLATRSQRRPNPIGVSVVPLLHHRKNVLQVQGLDATNGTPVLDVKPYLPAYDGALDTRLPPWAAGS